MRFVSISYLILCVSLFSCSPSGSKRNADSTNGIATDTIKELKDDGSIIPEPQGNPIENADARVTKRGFIITGEGSKPRAFTAFRAGEEVSKPYIKLVKDFREAFPNINLYAIVIPGAAAYYVPKKVQESSKPVKPAFDYLKENLPSSVKYVDVYNHLAGHTKEDIFLRTDHHWAPLGAYYTARALAAAANVPFKDLSTYDEHIVHGYVGSMFHYTGDSSIKNNPEDFHYYTPKGTNVTTTFTTYTKNKETGETSEGATRKGEFFRHYSDGAGGAYCTFMGGDHFLVKVETGVPNSRRLLIVKDSHGNPIPAYLFHSFEEIHVIDYRYFTRNLTNYINDNKITDIALAFGINTASTPGSMNNVRVFLTQNPEGK